MDQECWAAQEEGKEGPSVLSSTEMSPAGQERVLSTE